MELLDACGGILPGSANFAISDAQIASPSSLADASPIPPGIEDLPQLDAETSAPLGASTATTGAAGLAIATAAAVVGRAGQFPSGSTQKPSKKSAWNAPSGIVKAAQTSCAKLSESISARRPGFNDEYLQRIQAHLDTPTSYALLFVSLVLFCVFAALCVPISDPFQDGIQHLSFLLAMYPIQQVVRSVTAVFMLLAWFDIHNDVPLKVFYGVVIGINLGALLLYVVAAYAVGFPVPFFDMLTSPMLAMPVGIGICMRYVLKYRGMRSHFTRRYVRGTLVASFAIFVPVFVMGMPFATFLFRVLPIEWQFIVTALFPILRRASDKILEYGLGPHLYPGTAFIWIFCTSACYEMFVTSQFANFSSSYAVGLLVGADVAGNLFALFLLYRCHRAGQDTLVLQNTILLLMLREFIEALAPMTMGVAFAVSVFNGNRKHVRGWDIIDESRIWSTLVFYLVDSLAELSVMWLTVKLCRKIVPEINPVKLTVAWLHSYGHRLAIVVAGNAVFHLSMQFYHYGCDWGFRFEWLFEKGWACADERAAGEMCW